MKTLSSCDTTPPPHKITLSEPISLQILQTSNHIDILWLRAVKGSERRRNEEDALTVDWKDRISLYPFYLIIIIILHSTASI